MSINLPGSFTIVYSSGAGDTTIHSLTGSDDLSVAGGSLTVSTTSSLSGQLSIASGSLTLGSNSVISGDVSVNQDGTLTLSGGSLTLSGLTNVDNATVVASGGATLNLPSGTTYTGTTTLEATGAGSTLTLAGTTLAESTNGGSVLLIETLAGGSVTMPSLTSISGGPVVLESDGANSLINLSALQTFTSSGGATAINGGSIECGITLPAAPDVWINPGSGYWDTDSNWILGIAPGADMPVIISTAAAATITLDYYGDISVNSVTLGNSDTLSINDGATLNTTGNFTNSGSLTLDAGGQLSVGGNETETSSATINDQIGDTPASGDFSVLAVTDTVTLAGTFSLALLDGFTPSIGQDFPVITFASASGAFSTVTGLTGADSSFTETLKAKSLDLIVQPTPPTFTADSPPVATVGSPYSYQFEASGTEPITFSATGLPTWAQLNSSTGVLSGTPTAPGTFDFTVTASNGTAPNATANVALIAQYEPPTFTADTPP
ncbi:MAG TPA: putative Ig domain-containing protein, partial [Isosphaeraceae bacterium]|nr:putative Ig domain-containing protein [Isosphaeraceae bacterium]